MKAILPILLLALAANLRAAPTLGEETRDGKTVYRLANERLSLVVDPAAGGTVVEFRDRLGGDVDLIPVRKPRGIGIDHFQAQTWPGELYDAAYDVVGTEATAEHVAVNLRYVATGKFRTATFDKLEGLVLEKTWQLTAGSPALTCRVRLTAPETGAKLVAYWQQTIAFAGGDYERTTDFTYRPSSRGVRVKSAENNGHTGDEDFVRDFSAGWMALIDSRTKTGLSLLSDYNELNALYMNRGNYTMEPMFRRTFLPAGKAVEYELRYIPVVGLANVVSTTPDYVAGYTMTADGKGNGSIEFALLRSANPPAPVTFAVRVASALTPDREIEAGTVDFPVPGAQPVTGRVQFKDAGADPLVLRVTATVAAEPPREYRFEEYWNGTWKWGENLKTDMVSPIYSGERPPQRVTLQKPAKLQRRDVYGIQMWYIEGFLDEYYDFVKPAKIIRQEHENNRFDRSFVSYNSNFRTKLDMFPWDYEQLLGYDFIVLGGAKKEAFGLVGLEMLEDYLDAGGGMLVLGGPMAYGASRLAGTRLVDRWPVVVPDKPLNIRAVGNAVIEPVGEAPFLENLDWSAKPRVAYVHDVAIEPEGRVILAAGGHPFLVVRDDGTGGRIACILGAPMGAMDDDQTPFWEWDDWTYLVQQLCWWLQNDRHLDRFETISWAP